MKKNTKIFALAGLGALVAVGGTFAYYNASQTFQNPFTTSNFGTYATEKFKIEDGADWQPGAEVDKEVYATNTGDGNVWVRVKFNETWKNKDGAVIKSWTSSQDGFFVEDPKKDGEKPVAGQDYQPGVDSRGNYIGNTDGETSGDTGSVVYKKFDKNYLVGEINTKDDPNNQEKNTINTPGCWYFYNGYYYYTSALTKNQSTNKLLDSVTLCADADMGRFDNTEYYKITDKDVVEPPVFNEENWNSDGWVQGVCNFDPTLKGKTDKKGEPNYDSRYEKQYKPYIDKSVWTYKENKLDKNNQGYANAGYELNITVEFVQADEKAAQAFPDGTWAWHPVNQE